jgi:hypothetical protein
MTQPDDTPRTSLDSLPPIKWILLSVGLSIIGSLLITLSIGAIDFIRSQAVDGSAKPYVHEPLGMLYYFAFYSLIINLLGAAFLIAFFAIGKRLRR